MRYSAFLVCLLLGGIQTMAEAGRDGFHDNIERANEWTESLGPVALPLEKIRQAVHEISTGWRHCGLDAVRSCALIKGYTNSHIIRNGKVERDFACTEVFWTCVTGPRPRKLRNWIWKNYPGAVSYMLYERKSKLGEVKNFIKENLRLGNPVISIGCASSVGHYFPIVGWNEDTRKVYVLNNDGSLYWARMDYIEWYMHCDILTTAGYSVIAMH